MSCGKKTCLNFENGLADQCWKGKRWHGTVFIISKKPFKKGGAPDTFHREIVADLDIIGISESDVEFAPVPFKITGDRTCEKIGRLL